MEVQDAIVALETEIKGSELKVESLEREVQEIEKRERSKVVKSKGKGSKTTVLAGLAKARIQELKDALSEVRIDRDEGWARVKELEGMLAKFKEEYNSNFNDEGVKRAVRAWEEYAARDESAELDGARERDLDAVLRPDDENGINWEEWEKEEEASDVEIRKRSPAKPIPSLLLTFRSVSMGGVPSGHSAALGRSKAPGLSSNAHRQWHRGRAQGRLGRIESCDRRENPPSRRRDGSQEPTKVPPRTQGGSESRLRAGRRPPGDERTVRVERLGRVHVRAVLDGEDDAEVEEGRRAHQHGQLRRVREGHGEGGGGGGRQRPGVRGAPGVEAREWAALLERAEPQHDGDPGMRGERRAVEGDGGGEVRVQDGGRHACGLRGSAGRGTSGSSERRAVGDRRNAGWCDQELLATCVLLFPPSKPCRTRSCSADAKSRAMHMRS